MAPLRAARFLGFIYCLKVLLPQGLLRPQTAHIPQMPPRDDSRNQHGNIGGGEADVRGGDRGHGHRGGRGRGWGRGMCLSQIK